MKKTKLLIFLSILFIQQLDAQNESSFATHHILVIDKTASMVGKGTTGKQVDIWNDVQNAVIEYIEAIPQNDKVTIYTFAQKLFEPESYIISQESDRQYAVKYVKSIVPDGNYTGIYRALNEVFSNKENFSSDKGTIIYLFTDGENNIGSYSMKDVIDTFNANKGEFDHCYYVLLRNDLNIPNDVIQIAKNNSGFDTKKVDNITNFNSPIVIKPRFQKIAINIRDIGTKFSVEQRFTIIPPKENLVLSADINYDESLCNLDFLNAQELKIEPENNSAKLNFEFVGSSLNLDNDKNFLIKVKLKSNDDDQIITFQPNEFEINLYNAVGAVTIQGNGWTK